MIVSLSFPSDKTKGPSPLSDDGPWFYASRICWLHHPAAVGTRMMPTPVRSRTGSSELDTPTDGVADARKAWWVKPAVMSLLEDQNQAQKSNYRGSYLLLWPFRAFVTTKLPSRLADTLIPNAVVSSRFAMNRSGAL